MGGYILIGALAAFGLICAFWAALGWLIPGTKGGAMVCLCHPGLAETCLIRRYGWLWDLGFLREPILLIDCGLSEDERNALSRLGRYVEFCSLEELSARLEVERERLG